MCRFNSGRQRIQHVGLIAMWGGSRRPLGEIPWLITGLAVLLAVDRPGGGVLLACPHRPLCSGRGWKEGLTPMAPSVHQGWDPDRLRRYRERHGLTLDQVADA